MSKVPSPNAAILLAATRLNVPVWRPVGAHGRTDLVLDVGRQLWRVQVKWGRLSKAPDVVIVHTSTSRCTPRGYVRTTYTAQEIDLIGVYCAELDRCFLIPMSVVEDKYAIQLRLTPARNAAHALTLLTPRVRRGCSSVGQSAASAWQRSGVRVPSAPFLRHGAEHCRLRLLP